MSSSLTVPAFTRQALLTAAGHRPTPSEFSHAWHAATARAEPLLADLETAYEHGLRKLTRTAAARFKKHAHPLANITASADVPQFLVPDQRLIYDDVLAMLALRSATQPLRTRIATTILKDVGAELGLRFDLTNPLFGNALEQVGTKITQITETQRGEIMASLQKSYEAGDSIPHAAQALIDQGNILSIGRAKVIARTEFIGTVNGASLAAAQIGTAARWKQWLATQDDRTRDDHAEADGQVVPINEPFEVGDDALMYPGDPSGSAEETINCFPGETLVSGRFQMGFRAWYDGDLVTVEDEFGDQLAGTPNHPVLTTAGWQPLGSLAEGDYLIRGHLLQEVVVADPNIEHAPATAEQVFTALGASNDARRVASSDVNLYGDRLASDVDIVGANGLLEDAAQSANRQPGGEGQFAAADFATGPLAGERLAFQLRSGDGPAAHGGMRRSRESLTLIGRGVGHADVHRLPAPSGFDAEPYEYAAGGAAGDVERLGEMLLGFPCEITLAEVVGVSREPWAGHVYSFQTATGVYTANNIPSQNCRCTLVYPPDGGGM